MIRNKKFEEKCAAAARMECPPKARTWQVFEDDNPDTLGTVTISGGSYTTSDNAQGDLRPLGNSGDYYIWIEPGGVDLGSEDVIRWGTLQCNSGTGRWDWTETNIDNGVKRSGTLRIPS